MPTKRRIIIVAATVVFLSGLVWLGWRTQPPPEQMYHGRKLIDVLADLQMSAGNQTAREDATKVLQELGTNALPTLVQMVRAHDSPLKSMLLRLAGKQHLITIRHADPQPLNNAAFEGFRILGSQAAGATPELIKIFDQRLSFSSQYVAAICLGVIGPEARAAVPSLVGESSSTNEMIRNGVYWALGDIHASPSDAVPVLIKGLGDSYNSAQWNATRSLGNFGPEAKAAVPALVALIKKVKIPPSPSPGVWTTGIPSVGQTAIEALRKIDPEAAAKVT